MDITAANRIMNVPGAVAPETAPEQAAENRSIIQAVKALNRTEMLGHDNQVTFQRDPESKRIVIQVIDRNTQEVLSQIPAEYLLRLAEDLKPQHAFGTPVKAR